MFNVVEAGIPETHAGWHRLSFFVIRKLDIGSRTMSPYSFEKDVIRPYTRARDDPRVPFTAAGPDAQLDRETLAFLARHENFRLAVANRTVWLSEILDFYREDFVPRPAASIVEYANRYAPEQARPSSTR
ncbi:MAG TPA: hypothetical protein PK752_23350 [Accumulibacter sp.]|uniref:hypothetical protein n=1 Tax=Accumulibacter sp. TaxID=2053492 RepID=UPI002C6AAC5F|nr:hypothetical protein [Accumulibacter sp.]HRD91166.1 hypothetical protein [Accumulibacter sp.]